MIPNVQKKKHDILPYWSSGRCQSATVRFHMPSRRLKNITKLYKTNAQRDAGWRESLHILDQNVWITIQQYLAKIKMSLSYNPTISIPVHLYQDICVTTFTVIPMLAKYLKTDQNAYWLWNDQSKNVYSTEYKIIKIKWTTVILNSLDQSWSHSKWKIQALEDNIWYFSI